MNSDIRFSMRRAGRTLALLATLATAGCAGDPAYLDEDFGESVRAMVAAQKQNPPVASTDGAPTLDGQKGGAVLETYRRDVSKPQEVKQAIKIDVK